MKRAAAVCALVVVAAFAGFIVGIAWPSNEECRPIDPTGYNTPLAAGETY